MSKRIDWDALQREYVTSDISLRDMADKHGIHRNEFAKHSKREGWVAARKAYKTKVMSKALTKTANKQAAVLARELDATEKMSDQIAKLLSDSDQFNRHIVTVSTESGAMCSVEETFDKMDTKAMKDAIQCIQLIEKLKRSIGEIRTHQEMDNLELQAKKLALEEKKIELEERRLAIEEKKSESITNPDNEVRVIIEGFTEGWAD